VSGSIRDWVRSTGRARPAPPEARADRTRCSGERLAQKLLQAVTDDVGELSEQYAQGDLILLTRTRGWGFMYFPTDWDNYRVGLNVTCG